MKIMAWRACHKCLSTHYETIAPWTHITTDDIYENCKEDKEDAFHAIFGCPGLRMLYGSVSFPQLTSTQELVHSSYRPWLFLRNSAPQALTTRLLAVSRSLWDCGIVLLRVIIFASFLLYRHWLEQCPCLQKTKQLSFMLLFWNLEFGPFFLELFLVLGLLFLLLDFFNINNVILFFHLRRIIFSISIPKIFFNT